MTDINTRIAHMGGPNFQPRDPAQPFLAANPGWALVVVRTSQTGKPIMTGRLWVEQEPIIAWAFERGSGRPIPITTKYGCGGAAQKSHAILQPDGRVASGLWGTFDSTDDWLADLKQQCADRDAEQAAFPHL